MSDVKLWIDEVGCTVLVKNDSAFHILPLWVFESMRDIIVAEAEKEVEVTHHDFDIQQKLLDKYMAENAKLRELLADTLMQPRDYCQKYGIEYDSWDSANDHLDARMRELGVEVPDGD